MPVSLDFSERFSGNVSAYFLEGDWPQGLQIDANGVVSGNPVGQGLYKNLRVRAMSALGHKAAYTNYFEMVVTAFGALGPAFNGEMTGVIAGVGGLSTTVSTTGYVLDHEGIYREIAANEPRYSGGRVVENLLTYSEDLSNAAWAVAAATKSGNQITVTGAFGGVSQSGVAASEGDAFTAVGKVKYISGDSTVQLRILNNVSVVVATYTMSLTSEYKIFTVSGVCPSGTTSVTYQFLGATGTEVFEVEYTQLENATGRTDTATPSEYIGTTTAAVTKVFANVNGNSVASNVVTEGVGTPLAEAPYLNYIPAATNSIIQSLDLTTTWVMANTGSTAQDAVGITGKANHACTVTDSDAGARYYRKNSALTFDAGASTVRFFIKKDETATKWGYFSVDDDSANWRCFFNPNTGAINVWEPSAANTAVESIDDGDWWIFIIYGEGKANSVTTNIYIEPAASSNGTLHDVTAQGSVIVGNVEVYYGKTIAEVRGLPPIFTTTSAVSTDETVYTFDYANYSENGVWCIEVEHSFTDAENSSVASAIQLVTGGAGAYYFFLNPTTALIKSYDGTLVPTATNSPFGPGISKKYAVVYDLLTEQKFALNVDNVYGPDSTYGGFNTGTVITLCINGKTVTKLRNLQRYNILTYQDGKDKIDDLME